METLHYWATRVGLTASLLAVLVSISCSSPTKPTPPPPPPPVANPPSISCVDGISRATINAGGIAINFDNPSTTDGEGAVKVTCDPESGTTFPIGQTEVSCTATDTLNRSASCSFMVTISKLSTLSKTRFLAFGDSITAGEVTAPAGGSLFGGAGSITPQVVVPSASYPSVLLNTLRGRYSAQASSIEVFNYGFGGEKVVNSRSRYFSALNATLPEVLLLMEGANDIPLGEDGAASGAAQEISVWVAEAKARGIRVFLATPTPGKPGSRQIQPVLLIDYANRMRRISEVQGVTLVDLYTQMLPDVNRYIGIDGLHPNEQGDARIADLFFQAIQGALEVR
jgi:lysophospholipase L1-like esterase